jgi:L-alanine-DL-glutamate epimerase-like enolase superfamily enzyme
VKVAPHTAPHIHRHLVSALGDAAFAAESVGDPGRHPIHHAIYDDTAEAQGGMVRLTQRPGFGFEVDWKQVDRLRV